ncbi:alpha/beta fold hydrolase [Gordonia asplenii]|nr:alpha/beta fold hydrolase [Gordonia asplenii]
MPDLPVDAAPTVLIAPAMAIGSGYYRPLVEEFERRGWQARALRRRGFERDRPRASRDVDWSYADEIADIAAAVSTARASSEGPVILLGHSLGGQLVVGHELTQPPVDGVVTVGGAVPFFRHFAYGGAPLALMAGVVVPVTTSLFGYLPEPAFGAPGARTLMREWARMVLTGRAPFATAAPISTPSLIVSLGDDRMSPAGAVDHLAALFDSSSSTRWHYGGDEVPDGASNDHVGWVRTPEVVVAKTITWWQNVGSLNYQAQQRKASQ